MCEYSVSPSRKSNYVLQSLQSSRELFFRGSVGRTQIIYYRNISATNVTSRRTFLTTLGVVLPFSGCLSNNIVNPNLNITNESPDPAELQVTVTPRELGEEEFTPVMEETMKVDPFSTETISAFNRGRSEEGTFRVRAEHETREVTFLTRPICRQAESTIIITFNRGLAYESVRCEGPTRTGTATSD